MSNKLEPIFSIIETNLKQAKGEVFNFTENNKKKSASISRACFLNIQKACAQARKELQALKNALPTRRRTLSPETIQKMKDSRAAKKAARDAKASNRAAAPAAPAVTQVVKTPPTKKA